MMPGLGGMNPNQMKKIMKQMGMKSSELNANRVVIESDSGNLIIEQPQVTVMEIQGKKTYTILGNEKEETAGVPEEDVKMVAEQTGKTEEEAKTALEEANGDLAEAIQKLKE